MKLMKEDGKYAMCPIKMAAAIMAKDYQLSTMELTVCSTDCAWLGKYIDDDKTVYACGFAGRRQHLVVRRELRLLGGRICQATFCVPYSSEKHVDELPL